jgi:hypothetical protein
MIRAATLCLLAALAPACEKKDKDKDDKTEVPTGDDGVPKVEIDESVKQEPDPPELATAAQSYLAGQYDDTVAALQPLFADLKERKQYRASGLAGAWLALAHAKKVFEDGEEPADWAAAMAEATGDKGCRPRRTSPAARCCSAPRTSRARRESSPTRPARPTAPSSRSRTSCAPRR